MIIFSSAFVKRNRAEIAAFGAETFYSVFLHIIISTITHFYDALQGALFFCSHTRFIAKPYPHSADELKTKAFKAFLWVESSPGILMQTVIRFLKAQCSEGNKKVATKQTGHAFAFSEGLASRLCSDLKSQKGELPSPAGTERISKNM